MPAAGKAAGKGTRKAGGKAAARPAPSSTAPRGRRPVRLSPMDRVNRARRIAAARAKPKPDTWAAIAKREKMGQASVRRIYDDYLTWGRIQSSPDALVDHTLEMIEASLVELDDVIRAAAEDGNHAARVGAIRLTLEALVGRWEVMRTAGRLPAHMTRYRHDLQNRQLFEQFIGRLKLHGVGDAVIADVMGLVDGNGEESDAPAPRPPQIVEGTVREEAVPA